MYCITRCITMNNKPSPVLVKDDQVVDTSIYVGTNVWFNHWLTNPELTSFRYECPQGSFTARRRKGDYWNAYRKVNGKLRQEYLGKSSDLTETKLIETAKTLAMDNSAYWRMKYPQPQRLDNDSCITANEPETIGLSNRHTVCITEVTELKAELAELHRQLETKQAQIAQLSIEVEKLNSQNQLPDLPAIRDRFLLTQPPAKRRELKKALNHFIDELNG